MRIRALARNRRNLSMRRIIAHDANMPQGIKPLRRARGAMDAIDEVDAVAGAAGRWLAAGCFDYSLTKTGRIARMAVQFLNFVPFSVECAPYVRLRG